MAEETITILKVGTDEAVKSLGDLRANVKQLKANLDELEIGTQEYQDTLEELKINQNAVKDAMYATTASMEDLAASATGTSKTYNGLVHQMAALKEELRATDVATEAGMQRFQELAAKINDVNDELKAMDAMQGNFQRNVGNYAGEMVTGFDKVGGILKQFPPTFGAMKDQIGQIGETMQLVGQQPILGYIGLLAPLIIKITGALRENETAMDAVKKIMASLQPIFDLGTQAIEALAGWISKLVDYFVSLAGESGGTFKKIIAGAVGVGNVIVQYLATPIKTVIEIFKGFGNIVKDVFTGNFKDIKEHATSALEGIGDAFKNGFSLKANFEAGQRIGDDFAAGLGGSAPKAAEAGQAAGDAFGDAFRKAQETIASQLEADLEAMDDSIVEKVTQSTADMERLRLEGLEKGRAQRLAMNDAEIQDERDRAQKAYEIELDANNRKLALLQQFAQQAMESGDVESYLSYQQQAADLQVDIETNAVAEKKRLREQDLADAEAKAQQQLDTMNAVASGTSGILNTIADMYEGNAEESEKNAKKVKALRISAAVIDTLSGAITAFMQAQSLGPILGPIMGAVNAAAVTAAGVAQIAQLRKSQVSTSEGGGSSVTAPTASVAAPAAVAAPTVQTEVQNVRNLTGASEEEKLNQSQRVYIVASDIEASQEQRRVQVSESSF